MFTGPIILDKQIQDKQKKNGSEILFGLRVEKIICTDSFMDY